MAVTPDPKDAAAVAKFRLKKSYAYGVDIARAIQADEMDFDLASLIQGLSDTLNKKKLTINDEEYAQLMDAVTKEAEEKARPSSSVSPKKQKGGRNLSRRQRQKRRRRHHRQRRAISRAQKRRRQIPQDRRQRPSPSQGNVLNGDQFFSSYSLNQPSTFPVGRVIRGLKDAILQMKVGDKWQIYIPAELAFGKEGNTPAAPGLPGVGPNEVVIYEIELIDIVPEAQE